MLTCRSSTGAGALCVAARPSPRSSLATSTEPSSAGLFSWMKGRNQEISGGESADLRRQWRRPFRRLWRRPVRRRPARRRRSLGSRAFHGDELPPDEGNAATRAWITNPALGTPTLSKANIAATKAAIAKLSAHRCQWRLADGAGQGDEARLDTARAIAILHRRLEISGDLVGRAFPTNTMPRSSPR